MKHLLTNVVLHEKPELLVQHIPPTGLVPGGQPPAKPAVVQPPPSVGVVLDETVKLESKVSAVAAAAGHSIRVACLREGTLAHDIVVYLYFSVGPAPLPRYACASAPIPVKLTSG
jgi:hypothetical protein